MIRITSAAIAFAAIASAASAMPSLQATPAPLPDPAATEGAPAAVAGNRDPMKVVCRSMRPPSGTRIQHRGRERVCQTQQDWDNQSAEAQGATRDAIAGGAVNNKEFIGPGGISPEGGPR